MARREMADGMRYAAWRWQDLVFSSGLYLRKLYLWRAPWAQCAFHWILQPDPGRDLHDHPRDFVSIVLRGGYYEERPIRGRRGSVQWRKAPDFRSLRGSRMMPCVRETFRGRFSIAYRRAAAPHRISGVLPGTLTLVLWGRRKRTWGFHTVAGWVDWRTYSGLEPIPVRGVQPTVLERLKAWVTR